MTFPYKKYVDIRKLGTGTSDDVFIAAVQSTPHPVVLKKLSSPHGHYQGNFNKIDQYVKTLQALHHNNLIRIFEYGVHENSYYLSMEYIDGFDLEKLLNTPSFDRNIGLMMVFEALNGLMHAHKHGVFHFDIKPANILAGKNGCVKITDFGLAHVKDRLLHPAGSGSVFLTPYYMPPEQASAIAEQTLDSDIWAETTTLAYKETMQDHIKTIREQSLQWDMWSVGVLLYRVCTGNLPFNGENLAQLATSISTIQIRKVHKQIPAISAELSDLIDSCLEKDPSKRLATLDPVIAALQLYLLGIGVHDTEPEIRSHLSKYFDQPAKPEAHSALKNHGIGESPVPSQQKASKGRSRPNALRLTSLAITILAVVFLSALFVNNRSNSHAPSDGAPLQNRMMPENIPTPEGPKGLPVDPADRLPVQPTTAEGFLEVDSAIADLASSEKSSGPLFKKTARETGITGKRSSTIPGVLTQTVPPSHKSADSQSADTSLQIQTGILKLTVEPNHARVSVDGEEISSQEIAMGRHFKAGEHAVFVNAAGYTSYSQSLQVEPGITRIMSIILKQRERGSGFLTVMSYPWSTFYIDGQVQGTTPTSSPSALAEGEHTIRLERDGFLPYQETVTIKTGEVTRISVEMVKKEPSEQKSLETSPAAPDSLGMQ